MDKKNIDNPIAKLNEIVTKKFIANFYKFDFLNDKIKCTISFDGITSIGISEKKNDAKNKAAIDWLNQYKSKNEIVN